MEFEAQLKKGHGVAFLLGMGRKSRRPIFSGKGKIPSPRIFPALTVFLCFDTISLGIICKEREVCVIF